MSGDHPEERRLRAEPTELPAPPHLLWWFSFHNMLFAGMLFGQSLSLTPHLLLDNSQRVLGLPICKTKSFHEMISALVGVLWLLVTEIHFS